jgi:hypothetical protein
MSMLFVLLESRCGPGDFVGLDDGSGLTPLVDVPRVFSHDLSPASPGVGLNGRPPIEDCERESSGFGVEVLRGEPEGVAARTVEGERRTGDSGLLNGDARWPPNERGFMGLDGFDCRGSVVGKGI